MACATSIYAVVTGGLRLDLRFGPASIECAVVFATPTLIEAEAHRGQRLEKFDHEER